MRVFDMLTSEDIKRIKKDPEIRIKELENSLSIALEINDKYQRENALLLRNRPLDTMDEVAYRELQAENEKLKKKVRDAEGETSLVKAIGINSPEMKALRAENEELKAELARAKEEHQYDKLVYEKELKNLIKK